MRFARYTLPIGLAVAAFVQVLGFGFVYDDSWTIVDNGFIRDPANISGFFGATYFESVPDANRPVMVVSTMLDYQIAGLAPGVFHLHNLILHCACIALVLVLAEELFGDRRLALVGACLFAVHPLHIEPVAAVNYREDLLATLFVLSCLLAGRRSLAGDRRWRLLALGSAALAVLSKESALAVVPLAILCDELAPQEAATGRKRMVWYGSLAAVLVAAYLPIQLGFSGAHASVDADPAPLLERLATSARLVVTYAGQMLVPWSQSPEYPDAVTGWADWRNLAAAGILAAAVWTWRRLYRRRGPRVPLWALGWFALALLPALNIVPIYNVRADRYLYLPSVGAVIGVAWVLVRAGAMARDAWPRLGIAPRALAPAVVMALLAVTAARVDAWRDGVSLWAEAIEHAPASQRAWEGYATALAIDGDPRAAQAANRGLRQFPDSHKLIMARGIVRAEAGDLEGALGDLRRALVLADGASRGRVLHNLAIVHLELGDRDAARAALEDAAELSPRFALGTRLLDAHRQ